jgi:hypothetical protein
MMAVLDALKLRKFNKTYKAVWQIVWEQVKSPPSDDGTEVVAHLCYVGTLMYAVRYQVALAVGMSDSFAKSMAVIAVSKAGYDSQMEDAIYAVFSIEAAEADKDYVSNLYSAINSIIGAVKAGTSPFDGEIVACLRGLRNKYYSLVA